MILSIPDYADCKFPLILPIFKQIVNLTYICLNNRMLNYPKLIFICHIRPFWIHISGCPVHYYYFYYQAVVLVVCSDSLIVVLLLLVLLPYCLPDARTDWQFTRQIRTITQRNACPRPGGCSRQQQQRRRLGSCVRKLCGSATPVCLRSPKIPHKHANMCVSDGRSYLN